MTTYSGKRIHLRATWRHTLCQKPYGGTILTTKDWSRVTCLNCIKIMKKEKMFKFKGPERPSTKELREISIEYLRKEMGVTRPIVFGCDNCDSVEDCEFAYDPYNMDGDCLAEK